MGYSSETGHFKKNSLKIRTSKSVYATKLFQGFSDASDCLHCSSIPVIKTYSSTEKENNFKKNRI